MIRLDYKNDKPLHEQISQGIKELIIRGVLKSDEQLPSVRDMSVSLTVNPNTVQRAYKSLEGEGVIYSIRGKGNFVAADFEADKKQLMALRQTLSETVAELKFCGEAKQDILEIIDKIYAEGNENG